MAANQYGIDMADIYRTTEAVKGARTRNSLADLQLSEAQYKVDQRPVEQERKNKLTSLRQESVGGSVDAQQQLLALDPENGPSFIDAIGKMDEARRAGVKRNIDEIGRGSTFVLSGKTPEQQAQRYQTLRENMSPEAATGLPEVYDPAFMELSLSKATAMDKLLEAPKSVSVGGEDVLYRGGREIERSKKSAAKGSGGSGSGSSNWKGTTSINTIRRLTADLAGGLFDERTGGITKLQTGTRSDMQAVVTEASRLLQSGKAENESQAVTMAAQKLDVPYIIPELSGSAKKPPAAEDPLGIR
tara:strand:- start:242 stop:1144 length:903 start_codon:yes stop_codon:yes gene_type:complete